jgi:hypothetical protein
LRFFRNEYTDLLQEDLYAGPNSNSNGNGNGTKEALSPMI